MWAAASNDISEGQGTGAGGIQTWNNLLHVCVCVCLCMWVLKDEWVYTCEFVTMTLSECSLWLVPLFSIFHVQLISWEVTCSCAGLDNSCTASYEIVRESQGGKILRHYEVF